MANTSIYHNVPVLRQPKENSCWYTCMQMMTRYCRATGKSLTLKDPADDAVLKGYFIYDKGLPFADSERFAKSLGYSCAGESPDSEGITNLLLHSPVLYAGEWKKTGNITSAAGHWVIITGISEGRISLNDPMYGRQYFNWNEFAGGDLILNSDLPLFYVK